MTSEAGTGVQALAEQESPLAAEERLVHAAAAGDADAFRSIYDRFAAGLYAYAVRRLHDRERAEDLVQDVFLALVRRGSVYRARAPLYAFLYRIAHNRVINAWRDRRPEVPLEERPSATPQYDDGVDVRTALGRLPSKFREPIQLQMYEGLGYAEIAEVIGCPIGTVRSRIARGKGLLAGMLSDVKRGAGRRS